MAHRSTRKATVSGLAFSMGLAAVVEDGAAMAQGLDAEPIFLDIRPASNAAGGAAVAPILVAAFEPSDAAPLLAIPNAPEGVQLAALDVAPDLPLPSIIVGRIAPGDEARFGITSLLPATLAEFAFPHDDIPAREALRESDPELFASLVEGGHIDPPEGQLIIALQTEMTRMTCYNRGIDGDWGRGSRAAIPLYFDELEGVEWSGTEATNELFRAIVLNGDVECEPPQVTRAPASNTSSNSSRGSTRTTQTRTSRPAAPAQRAPAPKAQPKPKSNTGFVVVR